MIIDKTISCSRLLINLQIMNYIMTMSYLGVLIVLPYLESGRFPLIMIINNYLFFSFFVSIYLDINIPLCSYLLFRVIIMIYLLVQVISG